MPRQKKDYIPVSIRMEKVVYEKLVLFCEESGQPKTTAIERAILDYVEQSTQGQQVKIAK